MRPGRPLLALAIAALGLQAAVGAAPPAGVLQQNERVGGGWSIDRGDEAGDEACPDTARLDVVAAALQHFNATDLTGRRWTAADLRGRVLLLDFWATWCAPCLADLPRLQALWQRHRRGDFEILGVSLDATSRRAFVSWLNRNRILWPQIHERQGYTADLPRRFGIEQLPSTVVVDRDGQAVAIDVRGDRLVALIDSLVASGGRAEPDEGRP